MVIDLSDFDDVLKKNLFEVISKDKNCRYKSWEHCYIFFKENSEQILADDKMLDLASLNLAFYLASWGMYRGSSNLLQKDYKIHAELIQTLLKKCTDLWNEDITWEQLDKANKIVKSHYQKNGVTPTDTLITKVLMGILGCVPAYDRYFVIGLKEYNKTNKHISQSYNKNSFENLKKLTNGLKEERLKLNNKITYPKMRLLDAYFWFKGKELDNGDKKQISGDTKK